jgi:hypothetical protein
LRTLPLQLGTDGCGAGVAGVPECAADPDCRNRPKKVNGVEGLLRHRPSLQTFMSEKATKTSKTVTVSERNLQSAALRLLPKHNKLVSPEVEYLRRVLGDRATQQQIDEKVLLVRKLPWSEIVHD